MKVLLTNNCLELYAGTEVVTRDLALELKRQGHQPFVFSRKLGPISRELSEQGIEVVSDLAFLSAAPDIVHGHHHPPLVQALLQFPSIPAISVCHDATSHLDEPFYFPRILRYVAVDDRCRKRLERSPEVPSSQIEVIWNALDLERFRPRGPLPSKPRRALVFSNRTAQLPAVRRASKRMGLNLDVVGSGAGTSVASPESVLPRYDIVFAKARCALEAMAVGNAVVLCDFAGVGPIVTAENLDRLRCMNFGQGVLVNPLQPKHLETEIQRYDPHDAARVTERIRSEAGLVDATNRWVGLYRSVLAEFRDMHPQPHAERRAFVAYLRKWSYESRVHWEREQLGKLRELPLLGNQIFHFARRFLHWWEDR